MADTPEPMLDIATITLGEMVDLEDVTGEPAFLTLVNAGRGTLSAKGLLACFWIAQRRKEPAFTLEQARATLVMELPQVKATMEATEVVQQAEDAVAASAPEPVGAT